MTTTTRTHRRRFNLPARTLKAAALALAALVTLPACVGFETYPPMEGQRTLQFPNSNLVTKPIEAALKWTLLRYPPEGEAFTGAVDQPVAVSLPEGLSAESYRSILQGMPRNAAAATPDNAEIPTYIVERVWVRGDEARVDLFRPMTSTPPSPRAGAAARPEAVYQCVRLELRGGPRPWHVTAHRTFTPGAFDVPPRSTIPNN